VLHLLLMMNAQIDVKDSSGETALIKVVPPLFIT